MGLRRLGLSGLVALALAGGLYLRARQQNALWWSRVEKLCDCNGPTTARLATMSSVPVGGLDRVLSAQRRTLLAGCDDLRAAMTRRSALQSIRGAPLAVTPTPTHERAQRDVARELGLACGEEHRVFWEGLRARVERDRAANDGSEHDVVRAASEYIRIRDAMCGRRAVLSAPPNGYVLTAGDADRQGRTCAE